jgi:hypothetical protein
MRHNKYTLPASDRKVSPIPVGNNAGNTVRYKLPGAINTKSATRSTFKAAGFATTGGSQ